MNQPHPQPGFSGLDQAWAQRLAGDGEGALRLAASILLQAPSELGAAALVGRCLLDVDRAVAAGQVCEPLIALFIARGDLPGACYVANLALEAGGYAPDALEKISTAFGRDSARLSTGSPKPPPFPSKTQVASQFAALKGEPLLAAAEKALAHVVGQLPAPNDAGLLPKLPLFSELPPAMLKRLLGALEVGEFPAGAYLAREGEDGQAAFILVRGLLNVVRKGGSAVLAALGPGAIFGEMALVSASPRAASVVAVEPAVALRISRRHLEGLSRNAPAIGRELGSFCHRRMVSNLVRCSPILSATTLEQRPALVARFSTRTFQQGERLVTAGGEGQGAMLIASGGVEVRGRDGDGDAVVLAQLGPGQVVGEMSLVLRRPASADVVALHTTVALCLSDEAFRQVIKSHPELLRELYELALHREQETKSAVAQRALDVSDVLLY